MEIHRRNKFKEPPSTSLSGNARAVFGDIVYETHHHYLTRSGTLDEINQKLLSYIVNILELGERILDKVNDGDHHAPPYFRNVEQRLPAFIKALGPIKKHACANSLTADACAELCRTLRKAQSDLERLLTYISMSKPTVGAAGLNRFSFAVKTILKYDEKVAEVLRNMKDHLGILQSFKSHESSALSSLRSVSDDQVDLAKQSERESIRKWLDGQSRDSYIDICISKRVPGTCEWILRTAPYLDWSSEKFAGASPKVFFATASAGRGKSFIAANVISNLERAGDTVAAVFWTSESKYSSSYLDEIPRSWLVQLLASHIGLYDIAKTIWSHSKLERASVSEIWRLLREVLITICSERPLTLCVDGLDEYNQQQSRRNEQQTFSHQTSLRYESLISFLSTLKSTIKGTCCRLWCTSQPDPEIRSELSAAKLTSDGFQAFEYNITQDNVKEDVKAFARSVIEAKLPKKSFALKEDLAKLVTEKAEGQMLWVSLKERETTFLRPSYSENKCRKIIQDTPQGLEYIFKANMDRINNLQGSEKAKAYATLQFVRDAIRPLTVHEIIEALLVEDDDGFEEVPEDELPDDPNEEDVSGELVRLCGNFIAFDVDSDQEEPRYWKLRFAHSSIRDYVSKAFKDDEEPSLPKRCLRYLMCTNIWPKAGSISLHNHPFLPYAGSHFILHVNDSNRQELEPLLNMLLVEQWNSFGVWYDRAKKVRPKDRAKNGLVVSNEWIWETRIALAAAMGLKDSLQALCSLPDCDTSKKMAAGLVAASWQGNVELCELLIAAGAEVDMPQEDGQLALTMAASKGNKEVAAYLISQGANVNASQEDDATPLMLALRSEQTEMAELLLKHGADPTAFDANAVHPLLDAVRKTNTKMVKWFLNRPEVGTQGFVNRTTHRGDFPLLANAWWGGIDITHELLDHGADATQIGFYGRNPIYTSALRGHEDVFMLLLSQLKDPAQHINKVDEWEGTSILIAAVKGRKLDIVKKIVEIGADFDRLDYRSRSALDWSIWYGLDDIVTYLLTFMNVNPQVSAYKTWMPLHYACSAGKTSLAKILVEQGADTKAKTSDGCSALELACQNGHLDIVEMLLGISDARETINDECDSDDTPLAFACAQGYPLIVAALIDAGADVGQTSVTYKNFTVLDWALASGSRETVKVLLEKCDTQALSNINIMGAAAQSGSLKIYDFARAVWPIAGAESDTTRLSLAQHAALGGSAEITTLVLKEAPELLTLRRGDGSSPLGCALQLGHVAVARALLEMYRERMPSLSFDVEDVFDAIASNEVNCLQLLLDYDKDVVRFAMKEGWTVSEHLALLARNWKSLSLRSTCSIPANRIQPLMYAFNSAFHELVELLVNNGSDVMQESVDLAVTCLHIWASNGKVSLFKFFKDIDWEKALRQRSRDGWRPLLTAINCGQSDPCRRFLKYGGHDLMYDRVEPHFPMSWSAIAGATTLHLAAATANVEIARMIVDICGETALGWTDNDGATPWHYAAREDQVYMLEYLLTDCSADINAITNVGQTPLMLAIAFDCRNSAKVLLSRNDAIPTDPTTRSMLLAHAALSDSPFLLELLLKYDFKLTEFSQKDGVSLLHHSVNVASAEESETVEWLLEQGQTWDSVDNHGWSVVDSLRNWDLLDPASSNQKRSITERFGQKVYDDMTNRKPNWRKANSWHIDQADSTIFRIHNDGLTLSLHDVEPKTSCKIGDRSTRALRGTTANHFLLPTQQDSYFEVTIDQCGSPCAIAIGLDLFIGEKDHILDFTSLLFGDTGYFYWDPFTLSKFHEPFKQGDVLGCGIDYHASSLFFTYNGVCRGCVSDEFTSRMVPALYTMEQSMQATINFGDSMPFLFDVANHGYGSKSCTECYTSAGKLNTKCKGDNDETTSKTLNKIKKT